MKIIGKHAGQIMNLIENYVFKERQRDKENKLVLTDKECTLRWDERENYLLVTYADGTTERYDNMRVGPGMFVAVRLRRGKDSKLTQEVQSP